MRNSISTIKLCTLLVCMWSGLYTSTAAAAQVVTTTTATLYYLANNTWNPVTVYSGTTLDLVSESGSYWYWVNHNSRQHLVAQHQVRKVTSQTGGTSQKVEMSSSATIYVGPNYRQVYVSQGSQFSYLRTRTDTNNNTWYIVQYGAEEAYVYNGHARLVGSTPTGGGTTPLDKARSITLGLGGNWTPLGSTTSECPGPVRKHWGVMYPANHYLSPVINGKPTVCFSNGLQRGRDHRDTVATHEAGHLYIQRLNESGLANISNNSRNDGEPKADCYAEIMGTGRNGAGINYGCTSTHRSVMQSLINSYPPNNRWWCSNCN